MIKMGYYDSLIPSVPDNGPDVIFDREPDGWPIRTVVIMRGNGMPLEISAECAARGYCPLSGCDCK